MTPFPVRVVLSLESTARTAAPKEASVTKSEVLPGIAAEPNRTAVPAGELRVSVVDRVVIAPPQGDLALTGNAEIKPVLFAGGLPLTAVKRTDSSPEKKTWETVLNGPTGGVVWPRPNGRRASILPRPCEEKDVQETPDFAPVVPTHTRLFLAEAATVTGKSPGTEADWPNAVSFVGSLAEIENIVRELEPAFTANKY